MSLLVACKSGSPPPTEVDQEATNDVEQSADQQPEPAAVPAIPAPSDVAAVPADAEKSESGLAWKVLQKGGGDKRPGRYDIVTLNYTGWTPAGRMFETSQKQGSKRRGKLEDFMRGWMEGVQLMLPGEKRRFWIPGELAYGEVQGGDDTKVNPDRPKGMVVYDIELVEFTRGPLPARPTPEDVAEIPDNAKKSKSGLAWRVLNKGSGKKRPRADSLVFVHYVGWTTDGKMVDTSLALGGKPASFVVKDAPMQGWNEAIQMMVAGELRRVWIPEDLAFAGESGRPSGMLVYDIELLDFTQAPLPSTQTPEDVAEIPDDAKKSKSGLAWRVLKKGSGKKRPRANSRVFVHYVGWTTDGEMVDTSLALGGRPASFVVKDAPMQGWKETIQMMVTGELRRVWMPEDLAFAGESGRPSGMLVYDIQLVDFKTEGN